MLTKRVLRAAVPAVAVIVAASACGGGSSKNTSSSGGGKPTYTIGLQGPLSGGNAQLGINIKNGVQLAINQANAAGLPFTLKFMQADDQGSPTTAPSAAQSLVSDSSVIGVVGPIFSGATRAAEPLFSQAHLVSVTPSATAVDLTQHGWQNFYRAIATDDVQGKADADYLYKVANAKAVYSIDDAGSYGVGLAKAFDEGFKADGGTVTHKSVPGTTQCQAGSGNVQEYGAVATQLKSANPAAVFYGGYYCDFALLAKALRAAGYGGQLMSGDGSEDAQYVKQAGAQVANGTLLSCACADILKVSGTDQFVADYKKLANEPPAIYSGEGYDVANAIISVLKDLASKNGAKNITRQQVSEAMASVNYKGLTKTISFGPDHNVAGSAIYIYKVENGTIVQLGLASNLAK